MGTVSASGENFLLESGVWVPQPLAEVFAFFSDPLNLRHLVPPSFRFRILRIVPPEMKAGTRIDYRLRLYGIPASWQSEITVFDPPHRFVDEQVRGPYRLWIHDHRFAASEGGTDISDRVSYRIWGGRLVEKLLVRRKLGEIFRYRQQAIRRIFGGEEFASPPKHPRP